MIMAESHDLLFGLNIPKYHIASMKLTTAALMSCSCLWDATSSQSCCPLTRRELVRGRWVTIRTSCAQSSISRCKSSGRLFSLALTDLPLYELRLLLLLLAWAWARPITGWWGGGVTPPGSCCDWLEAPDAEAAYPENTHTMRINELIRPVQQAAWVMNY